jgi:hypothetical protein
MRLHEEFGKDGAHFGLVAHPFVAEGEDIGASLCPLENFVAAAEPDVAVLLEGFVFEGIKKFAGADDINAVANEKEQLAVGKVRQDFFHGGDLPQGGSSPTEIVDQIRDLGWQGVLGNTDEMLFAPESLQDFAKQSPKLRPAACRPTP